MPHNIQNKNKKFLNLIINSKRSKKFLFSYKMHRDRNPIKEATIHSNNMRTGSNLITNAYHTL